MAKNTPLLSICIPTYNRAEILRGNLQQIQNQLSGVDAGELELVISDNCSPDGTPEVVDSFLQKGVPITYNRNPENVGADRNFLKCMDVANGKYILLLGDDDYLRDGAIAYLLDCLRGKDYGLLHIDTKYSDDRQRDLKEFTDVSEFVMTVSYWYTFMSGNIFRKDVVGRIDGGKYIGTNLLQMPYFLESTMSCDTNAAIYREILDAGKLSAGNGGYNLFEVFVRNYLTILSSSLKEHGIDGDTIKSLKKDLFSNFLTRYIRQLLIRRELGNFKADNGWKTLSEYYGRESYFYGWLLSYPFGVIKRRMRKIFTPPPASRSHSAS